METSTETAQTFDMEVSRTVKEVKQIALPHYRKTNCHAYKVFSKDRCIQVTFGGVDFDNVGAVIGIYYAGLAWHNDEGTECTEQEFQELYEKTEMYIREK